MQYIALAVLVTVLAAVWVSIVRMAWEEGKPDEEDTHRKTNTA